MFVVVLFVCLFVEIKVLKERRKKFYEKSGLTIGEEFVDSFIHTQTVYNTRNYFFFRATNRINCT